MNNNKPEQEKQKEPVNETTIFLSTHPIKAEIRYTKPYQNVSNDCEQLCKIFKKYGFNCDYSHRKRCGLKLDPGAGFYYDMMDEYDECTITIK